MLLATFRMFCYWNPPTEMQTHTFTQSHTSLQVWREWDWHHGRFIMILMYKSPFLFWDCLNKTYWKKKRIFQLAEQNIWEKSVIHLSFKNNQSLVLRRLFVQQQKRRSMTYPSLFSEPQKSFSLVFNQHELSLVKHKEVFSFFFSVCIPFLFFLLFLLLVTRGIVGSRKVNHNVLWKPVQSLVIFWPIQGFGNCTPLEGSDDDVKSDTVPGSTHPAEDILSGGLPETAHSCQWMVFSHPGDPGVTHGIFERLRDAHVHWLGECGAATRNVHHLHVCTLVELPSLLGCDEPGSYPAPTMGGRLPCPGFAWSIPSEPLESSTHFLWHELGRCLAPAAAGRPVEGSGHSFPWRRSLLGTFVPSAATNKAAVNPFFSALVVLVLTWQQPFLSLVLWGSISNRSMVWSIFMTQLRG